MEISDILVQFINKRHKMIENEEWEMLYDEAYDNLTQDRIKELTELCKSIYDPHTIDLVIVDVLKDKISDEIYNFIQDERHYLKLDAFVRMYFNSMMGLSRSEFENVVVQSLDNSNYYDKVYVDEDAEGDLALYRIVKL